MTTLRALACSIASGAVLALAFPSFGLWPLAWVGLAPLLLAVRKRRPRAAFAIAWVGWLVFSLLVLYWIAPTITNYTRIGVGLAAVLLVLLAAAEACFIGGFAALLEWLAASGISRVIAAPAVWVSIEWLRTFFPAAFPWAFLGYTQQPVSVLMQSADLGAVYVVSALLVFANATLAEILVDGPRRHRALLLANVLLVAATLAYGFARIADVARRPVVGTISVGIVQGNIPQEEKWDPANQDATLDRYLAMSAQAVEQGARLIVWPEAAVPFFLALDRRAERITRFASRHHVWLLVGAPGYERRDGGPARQYNQAWMVTPEAGLVGPYDKIQLVPFGEYVPFGGLLGWVEQAVEAVGEFGRGTRPVVFDGPPLEGGTSQRAVRLAPLICYEGIFPDLVRRFVAEGADVLVNISNDAWYGRTSAPHQHLAMAAVRSIETRRPMVRATNTGVSAFVDSVGRISGTTRLFTPAVVVERVVVREASALYTRIGDIFVYACVACLFVLAYLRRRLGTVVIG